MSSPPEDRSERQRRIAAAAATLRERWAGPFVPVESPASDALAATRLARWRSAAAGGDDDAFRRRLALEGLDEADALRALRPARLPAEAPLPRWVLALDELLGVHVESADRALDPAAPLPFEEVLTPFVAWARRTVERRAPEAHRLFAPGALARVERQLLGWLCRKAARTLALELSLELGGSTLDALVGGAPPRDGYLAFVDRLRRGGLLELLGEFPVLARGLVETAMGWSEATTELVERFAADRPALGAWLGAPGPLAVEELAASLSDPHRGLRTVVALTLSGGHRVVYKPRPLGVEAAWNTLLAELGAPSGVKTYSVLDRGDYGWAEFVDRAPARSAEEGRAYFRRSGELLGLVYLLNGVDCHAENAIQVGGYPVLIDAETLLHPEVPDLAAGPEAPKLAARSLLRSVLHTQLLPLWMRTYEGDDTYDGSGLGGGVEPTLSAEEWRFVNSDWMHLGRAPVSPGAIPAPTLADGSPLRVEAHEDQVVEGFRAMLSWAAERREWLLGPHGPLAAFEGRSVRFVYRATAVYHRLLGELARPEHVLDGAERSLHLERLARVAVRGGEAGPDLGPVFLAERDALERGDLPYFSATTTTDALRLEDEVELPGWFVRPPLLAVRERIAGLGEDEVGLEVDRIRSALHARSGRRARSRHFPREGVAWIDGAQTIAAAIAAAAVRGRDGSAVWYLPVWSREALLADPRRGLDVAGPSLYDGATGISLFLGAVARVTGDRGLHDLAIGAVAPLIDRLDEDGPGLAAELGLGGLTGMGSVVYGLTKLSALLDDRTLLTAAERAAERIEPDAIDADLALDVTNGAAGALLGLLAIHEATGSAEALARAVRCGRRIVARLEPTPAGPSSVRTLDGRFLAGFSHGASGVAYALARLQAVAPAPALTAGIEDLLAFERAAFVPAAGDWPDLRSGTAPTFARGWCHGAPGIALARAGLLGLGVGGLEGELERAVAVVESRTLPGDDHLCCGATGVLECLRIAGAGDPERTAWAEERARGLLRRWAAHGGLALHQSSTGRLQCWGLFSGLAGVGLALLRWGAGEVAPDVLRLR